MAGQNVPNDVAASLHPVVKEGEASVGNKVGETHGGEVWFGKGEGMIE